MGDSQPMKVTVYSDYVCPFCYMGEASLATLMQNETLDVAWRAFELRPEGGPPMEESYKERIRQSWPQVQAMGREYGVEMRAHRFGVNTRLAHRALKVVQRLEPAQADGYHIALFRAYFEEDLDISQADVLVEVAERQGVDGDALRAALATDEALAEVMAEEQEAYASGISGVPAFVFMDKYLASGVRPPEQLAAIVQQIRQQEGMASDK